MSEQMSSELSAAAQAQEDSFRLMDKLVAVAQPGSVFSEPVVSGDYTVITASEVSVGMGFGYGLGRGGPPSSAGQPEEAATAWEGGGVGGGGGGGGGSAGRPIAVITIGPGGVRVEPIVDFNKIGIALLTTVGSMLVMVSRIAKASRR